MHHYNWYSDPHFSVTNGTTFQSQKFYVKFHASLKMQRTRHCIETPFYHHPPPLNQKHINQKFMVVKFISVCRSHYDT